MTHSFKIYIHWLVKQTPFGKIEQNIRQLIKPFKTIYIFVKKFEQDYAKALQSLYENVERVSQNSEWHSN